MLTIDDAKSMARAMEGALRAKNVSLTHGECLNIVARQLGLKDWNIFSAQAKRTEDGARRRISTLKGWAFLGEHPEAYDHGVDPDQSAPGGSSAIVRHDLVLGARRYPDPARAFGCYMQTVSAVPFHGKCVEISASLRCQGATHGVALWARVDGMPGNTLAFDNLKDAPEGWLFGSKPWLGRRVVIDVPAEGVSLHYGFFLKGRGAAWAANFSIRQAIAAMELTALPTQRRSFTPTWTAPTNLTFSEVIDQAAATA